MFRSIVIRLFAAAAALVLFASPVWAEQLLWAPKNADGSSLVLGVGAYDTGAFGGHTDTAASFALDYRHDWGDFLLGIKPWVGGFITTDATVYGGAGLYIDFEVLDNFYLTPSFGIGAWGQGNSDKDLGHALEFRSAIEATYRFANGSRLGVQFYHMSNAGIGDDNPGQESVMAVYVLPLGELRKLY